MNIQKLLTRFAAIATLAAVTPSVFAGIITYDVTNKAPGALANPDYGLRLDDLFTSPTDSNWTFDFNNTAGTSVQMDVDTDTAEVRIYGTVFGGRDIGSAWDSATTAFWELDFLYSDGVTITDAATGLWSLDFNADNFGSLKLLDDIDLDGDSNSDLGRYLGIGDYHGGSFVASGGPAPQSPYVSAWLENTDGFIDNIDDLAGETYFRPNGGGCCMDFGFRADQVPEPSSLLILAFGLLGMGLMERRLRA